MKGTKYLTTILSLILVTALLFTGCGKKDTEAVVSEVVEEIEKAEPVDETEPVEEVETAEPTEVSNGEYNGAGEDVEVEGEIVEGTALTQEEIDELKSSAETDLTKMGLEAYEAIVNNGSYTASSTGVTFTNIVGTPGSDGWCKFDDRTETIYYDEAAWKEVEKQRIAENYQEPVWDDTDVSSW